jgi:hypothetical protein
MEAAVSGAAMYSTVGGPFAAITCCAGSVSVASDRTSRQIGVFVTSFGFTFVKRLSALSVG